MAVVRSLFTIQISYYKLPQEERHSFWLMKGADELLCGEMEVLPCPGFHAMAHAARIPEVDLTSA